MESKLQTSLSKAFSAIDFQYNYPLANLTYFKVGGPAEVFVQLSDRGQIIDLISFCHQQNIKLTMFGGASNVIVPDEGVKGIVLQITNDQVEVDGQTVIAGAGIKTALLVRQTIDAGLTGLEYFLGVPGTLGGAVYNNAHYLQHLIGEHISRVEIIHPDGTTEWLSNEDCDFGYDSSRFQTTQEVILRAEFTLEPGTKEESQALIVKATQYRAQTQPLGEPSSGCIFQNTPNTPKLQQLFPQFKDQSHVGGGFLIDQAGLKGEKVGDIEVSHKHAAFFVNKGNGTAKEALELIEKVKQRVKDQFDVELHEEVFVLGQKH